MIRGHVFAYQTFSNEAFALFMDFLLAHKSGVIKGCAVSNTSSSVSLGSGYLWIKGRPIQIVGTETIDVANDSMYNIFCLVVDLSRTNTTESFTQAYTTIVKSASDYPTLTQQDLTDGGTVYQFPLAKFKTTNGVISDFVNMVERIDYNSIYQLIQDTLNGIIDGSTIADMCKLSSHPVGNIIIMGTADDPNVLLGGTWITVASGKALVGQNTGTFATLGASVGNESKTSGAATGNTGSTILTTNQMPSHNHSITDPKHSHNVYSADNGSEDLGGRMRRERYGTNYGTSWGFTDSKATGITINNNGGNQGHVHTLNSHTHSVNVVQPSYVVKFWLRTA